ncbi:MAG: RluA family pseudouridine synthase [Bacteroidota bacterium]|nr:RluA family pseudouridine synthase [Bacteroidota bacterium]
MSQEVDNNIELEETDDLYEHYSITVDKGQGPLRVDKFLTSKIENATRNRIQNAATSGAIRVNDLPVKSNYKVRPFDKIAILLPEPPRETELKGENIPLEIIYEDEYLLIVNKPYNMVVHPGYNNYTGTLVNALVYHFEQLPTRNGENRPGLVHRIDKDTSGLLVIAKEEYAMSHLAKQFFDHSIRRSYRAVVWGTFTEESGTVNAHLDRSLKDRRIVQAFPDGSQGKHAITHYKVVESYHFASLIECVLETGRTHQIRAHMKHIGHPVFNDNSYDGDRIQSGPAFTKYKQFVQNCFSVCPRQALHAFSLGFIHPNTGKDMYFEAPLPTDMTQLVEKWRDYTLYFKNMD